MGIFKHAMCFFVLLIFSGRNTLKSQNYVLETFQGSDVKIALVETMGGRTLSIIHQMDTLHLVEFVDIKDVRIIEKKFMLIIYDVRGGTGLDVRNTVILSVDHNKLFVSLLVNSYVSSFTPDKEYPSDSIDTRKHYQAGIDLTGDKKSNYKLIVHIQDERKSKKSINGNFNRRNIDTLSFDPFENIFYSGRQEISKYLTFYDDKLDKKTKQYVKGIIPTAYLGKARYYYINEQWYEKGYDDILFSYLVR